MESELARAKALRAEAIALRDQGDKRGALTKVREAKEVEAKARQLSSTPPATAQATPPAAHGTPPAAQATPSAAHGTPPAAQATPAAPSAADEAALAAARSEAKAARAALAEREATFAQERGRL